MQTHRKEPTDQNRHKERVGEGSKEQAALGRGYDENVDLVETPGKKKRKRARRGSRERQKIRLTGFPASALCICVWASLVALALNGPSGCGSRPDKSYHRSARQDKWLTARNAQKHDTGNALWIVFTHAQWESSIECPVAVGDWAWCVAWR